MIYSLSIEQEDYARLAEIKPLVSAFNRAVQFTLGKSPDVCDRIMAATTARDLKSFTEAVESYQTFIENGYSNSEEAESVHAILTMSLKNHYMGIVRRAVPDEQLAVHVSGELATERNAALLDKYRLSDVAAIVRAAAPKPAVG